jgi:GNAT superfamily N-acetyltransferase
VFNDGDESAFFNHYFDTEFCIIATRDDMPVATGYLLPSGNIICNELSIPCAMIYGVATLPEHRKLGFGAAVVRELVSVARRAGFPAVVLCPSNDGLFEYYNTHTGFRDWFYIQERKFTTIPVSGAAARLVEISPDEYSRIRKSLLSGIPHIEPDLRALLYQESLCQELGGGLFRVDTPCGVSCAVAERQSDGALWIKELLTPDGYESDVIAALASALPAEEYVIRTPAGCGNPQQEVRDISRGEGFVTEQDFHINTDSRHLCSDYSITGIRRFGMLSAPDSFLREMPGSSIPPWFGLAFD